MGGAEDGSNGRRGPCFSRSVFRQVRSVHPVVFRVSNASMSCRYYAQLTFIMTKLPADVSQTRCSFGSSVALRI